MSEDLPLRPNIEKGRCGSGSGARLEAHRAGWIRTAEVRSTEILGAGAVTPMTLLVLPKVLAGKRANGPRLRQTWTRRTDGPTSAMLPAPCSPSQWTPDPGASLARADLTSRVVQRGGHPGRRASRRSGSAPVRDALASAVARRLVQPDGPCGAVRETY
jgi:hypothetical protein